jgi:hypothetical protein
MSGAKDRVRIKRRRKLASEPIGRTLYNRLEVLHQLIRCNIVFALLLHIFQAISLKLILPSSLVQFHSRPFFESVDVVDRLITPQSYW